MPDATESPSLSADAAAPRRKHHRDRGLELIAFFKLVKAVLLIASGLGAFELIRPAVLERIHRWITALSFGVGQRFIARAFAWASGQSPSHLRLLGLAAFAYAALFLVEGIGLFQGKRWAEYLTVIATGSLIPFEGYEIVHRASAPRILALVINVAVVIYLIVRLRQKVNDEQGDTSRGERAAV